jgi:hypothetical protein
MAAARIEEVQANTESRYRLAEAFYHGRGTSAALGCLAWALVEYGETL